MSVRTVQLEDVCDVTDGTHYTPPNSGGPFPFLTVKDMTEDGLAFKGCSYVAEVEFAKARSAGACPSAGDVLFSKDGTVGKVHVVSSEKPFAVLSSIAILRPDRARLDSGFLGYALRNPAILRDATNRKTGSALQRIILGDLKEVSIPLPDLSEQKRIAGQLEQADRLRRTRRYALELSDSFLKSVFLEMFGDPARNSKGWDRVEFETLGVLDRGRSRHRPRNAPHLYGGPYPFIQTGDIASCENYIKEHYQTYSEDGLKQSKVWPAGTLCITIAANIANTGILTYPACFPDSVVGFLPRDGVVTEYVQYWLSFLQELLEKNAPESAQKNINLEILGELIAPLPPLSLQQRFADVMREHERLRAQQREALRQADHLFQSLLHRAFKGMN